MHNNAVRSRIDVLRQLYVRCEVFQSRRMHGLTCCTGRKRQEQIEGFEQQIEDLKQEILWLRSSADIYQAQQPLPVWDMNHVSAPPTDLVWPISCKVPFQVRGQATYEIASLRSYFFWF